MSAHTKTRIHSKDSTNVRKRRFLAPLIAIGAAIALAAGNGATKNVTPQGGSTNDAASAEGSDEGDPAHYRSKTAAS